MLTPFSFDASSFGLILLIPIALDSFWALAGVLRLSCFLRAEFTMLLPLFNDYYATDLR